MAWTIWSVGDGRFLTDVLEATAMIFSSGLTQGAFALALLLGVLYQGFKGTAVAKGLDLAQVLAVFIIYGLFFLPKTTVTVIDSYSEQVRTVSGVPLGPAVAGGLVSSLAHGFATKFAQAFGQAQDENRGFMAPLKTLSRIRSTFVAVSRLESVNKAGGGDFIESWCNYFAECTNIGLNLGILDNNALLVSSDPLQGALFSSGVYGTKINTNGSAELSTCTVAHQKLLAYTKGPYMTKFLESLDHKEQAAPSLLGQTDQETLRAALTALGLADTAVRDYVLAAVLLPIYNEATMGQHLGEGAFTQALMIKEATLARNTRLVAEESFFLKSVRPLLSFLEALVYALCPFMPLILGFGWGGFMMLGRYAQVLLWCAVLEPLMMVVNLFVLRAASGELAALEVPVTSFKGLGQVLELTEDYVALGGLLMSAVPVLAGLLVYGSSHALSSVMAGASGGVAINTEAAHPSLTGSAPVTASSPLFEKSLSGGVIKDGGRNYVADFSVSKGYEEAFSDAQSKAQSARSAFSSSLAQTEQSVFGRSVSTSLLEKTGYAVQSSRAESAGTVNNVAQSLARSFGLDAKQENALRGAVSSVLSGGGGDANLLSSLTIGASKGSSKGESVTRLAQALNSLAHDESLKASFAQSVSRDVARGINTGFTHSETQGVNSALQDSAERAVAAEEALTYLKNSKASLGAAFNLDGAALAKTVANNEGLFTQIGQHISGSHHLTKRTNQLASTLGEYFPESRQAYVAAAFTAMLETEPNKAYGFMAQALNVSAPNGGLASDKGALGLSGTPQALWHQKEAVGFAVGRGPNTKVVTQDLSTSALPNKAIASPEYSFSAWREDIKDAYQDQTKVSQAPLKNQLAAMLSEDVGAYSVRSAVDASTAEGEVGKLGLSGNCADVYMSFAQGQVPDAKKLQALEHEFGGDEVGRGAVRRLRAAALSGDLSIAAPLVSWQELGRK